MFNSHHESLDNSRYPQQLGWTKLEKMFKAGKMIESFHLNVPRETQLNDLGFDWRARWPDKEP